MATVQGLLIGGIVILVAMAMKVIWMKPPSRIPEPPPGYFEWLKQTSEKE
jgi:hypothetical protein